MANITAEMVKNLREKTGMGMMECKKALEETAGDTEKAVVLLRERGMARAAKRSDKIAAEGLVEVFVTADGSAGVVLEVNCQTDFVAKNPEFLAIAREAAQLAITTKAKTTQELLSAKIGDETVEAKLLGLSGKIGEKLDVRRLKVLTAPANGIVAGYSHMGGKIGTLVVLDGIKGAEGETLGKDIAMHIAAASPRCLNEQDVDQAELATERDIAKKKLEEEGKKPEMIEKILVGQMKKFYKEICLIEQGFVKNPDVTVQKHVESTKAGAKIASFARFGLGEGIERKVENFAEEVAAQAAQMQK